MNDHAYEELRLSGRPMSIDKLRKALAKKLNTPSHRVEAQLSLETDERFRQVTGSERWILADWIVCNDEVYTLLLASGHKETSVSYVYHLVATNIQVAGQERKVWLPEIDERVEVLANGKIRLQEASVEQTTETFFADENEEELEMLAEIEQGEQFTIDVYPVGEKYQKAVEKLEEVYKIVKKREREMTSEVIERFQEGDLKSIRKLMDEKKVVAEMKNDVKQLLQKWGR